jgi:hypothetical protein
MTQCCESCDKCIFYQEDCAKYVCITHQTMFPCTRGDQHLLSNWSADVKKIISIMETE